MPLVNGVKSYSMSSADWKSYSMYVRQKLLYCQI